MSSWYEKNKQYASEKQRLFYQAHREEILARRKTPHNKERMATYAVKYRSMHKENAYWYRLTQRFNLSKEAYIRMYKHQGGQCAICGKSYPFPFTTAVACGKHILQVDHDHNTGIVRGLLCVGCNRVLHRNFSDWLPYALRYLGLSS